MKILIHVDTNSYNDQDEDTQRRWQEQEIDTDWSLFQLQLATFQQWQVAGQTGYWTIDGETYCGTAYDCEVNYSGMDGELLLRCLIGKIKNVCGDRLLRVWIDGLEVKWTEDMMEMRPEWIETIKNNR